jgi:hypothetical protein
MPGGYDRNEPITGSTVARRVSMRRFLPPSDSADRQRGAAMRFARRALPGAGYLASS